MSVVLPVFNEEENIPILIEEIRSVLDENVVSWELIAVDDGSTDASVERLHEAQREFSSIRVIRFEENRGQSAAFDAGWRAARGEFIVTLDSDLQNDPADIPAMLAKLRDEEADMVIGVRVNRRDTAWKRLQSKIGNGVRNWITGDQITDTGCSLKLVRRHCVDRVKLFNGLHRFLPTLVRIEGYRVVEIPVNHRERRFGESKYGALNRAFRGLADCLAVRWMSRRRLGYRIKEEGE